MECCCINGLISDYCERRHLVQRQEDQIALLPCYQFAHKNDLCQNSPKFALFWKRLLLLAEGRKLEKPCQEEMSQAPTSKLIPFVKWPIDKTLSIWLPVCLGLFNVTVNFPINPMLASIDVFLFSFFLICRSKIQTKPQSFLFIFFNKTVMNRNVLIKWQECSGEGL